MKKPTPDGIHKVIKRIKIISDADFARSISSLCNIFANMVSSGPVPAGMNERVPSKREL
tara:strand:+ start:660 stop:836 length:177 start_codon:yes stop_codon:yes gene_type:complete